MGEGEEGENNVERFRKWKKFFHCENKKEKKFSRFWTNEIVKNQPTIYKSFLILNFCGRHADHHASSPQINPPFKNNKKENHWLKKKKKNPIIGPPHATDDLGKFYYTSKKNLFFFFFFSGVTAARRLSGGVAAFLISYEIKKKLFRKF